LATARPGIAMSTGHPAVAPAEPPIARTCGGQSVGWPLKRSIALYSRMIESLYARLLAHVPLRDCHVGAQPWVPPGMSKRDGGFHSSGTGGAPMLCWFDAGSA
jgi:hypothetical protein